MSRGILFILLIIGYLRRWRQLWSFSRTEIQSIRGMKLIVSKQFHRQVAGNMWHYLH